MSTKNQCDGCKAGKQRYQEGITGSYYHFMDEGGLMSCTQEIYGKPLSEIKYETYNMIGC